MLEEIINELKLINIYLAALKKLLINSHKLFKRSLYLNIEGIDWCLSLALVYFWWTLICFVRLPPNVQRYRHWGQEYLFSFVWILLWIFNWCLKLKRLSHPSQSQACRLSFLWLILWLLRHTSDLVKNWHPGQSQSNSRSECMFFWWEVRLPLILNDFPQPSLSQTNGRSSTKWIFLWWALSVALVLAAKSQLLCSHLNGW